MLVVLAIGLFAPTAVHADVTPPGRAEVVIELVLENQAAFPDLGFVAVDCWPSSPPGIGVAHGADSIRCLPTDPISVYAISRAELSRISAVPTPRDAKQSILAHGKACGTIATADTEFAKPTNIVSAWVTYSLEATPDGECHLHRVSVVGETIEQLRERGRRSASSSVSSGISSSSGSSASSPPDATSTTRSGCGACAASAEERTHPSVSLLVIALGLVLRRQSRRRL